MIAVTMASGIEARRVVAHSGMSKVRHSTRSLTAPNEPIEGNL